MSVLVRDTGGVLASATAPGGIAYPPGPGGIAAWVRPRASQFSYWRIFGLIKSNGNWGIDFRYVDGATATGFYRPGLMLQDNSAFFTRNLVLDQTSRVWRHLAVTWTDPTGSPDALTVAVDGRVRGVVTTSINPTLPTSGAGTVDVMLYGGGELCDLQVFPNTLLTAADMALIYHGGRHGRCAGRYYVGSGRGVDLTGRGNPLPDYSGTTKLVSADPPALQVFRRVPAPFWLDDAAATASAATPNNPAQSTAVVPSPIGVAGTRTVTVTARTSDGTPMTVGGATVVVTVTGANPATPAVTDNGNGTYTASQVCSTVGTDSVAITMGGVAIGGSPYAASVIAGSGSVQLINGGLIRS